MQFIALSIEPVLNIKKAVVIVLDGSGPIAYIQDVSLANEIVGALSYYEGKTYSVSELSQDKLNDFYHSYFNRELKELIHGNNSVGFILYKVSEANKILDL